MTMNAFKDGLTVLNQDNLNALLSLQPFQLIYEGTQRSAKIGSGVVENNIADYSFCSRFTLTGSTAIDRVELEVDRDGNGADLVLQIRSGMNPAGGNDGTLLKQVVVPKEFIPTTKAYWSIPVGLAGLTSGGQYWLVVKRGGDATHHLDWVGETAQDSSYPAYYRAGDNGAWTANNALHFRVYSGISTNNRAIHVLVPNAYMWLFYDAQGFWQKVYTYCPAADTHEGGIRQKVTINRSGSVVTSMEVV